MPGATRWLASLALVTIPLASTPTVTSARAQVDDEEAPEGVEILLPRGKIAAVFEPQFVKAQDADIAGEAWVLGVVLDGEAKAYSLNLLNHHEVVNDRFGDKPIAAVW